MKSLKGRPSIITFDSIVIDDVQPRILGFTTQYIPGGSLDANRSRPFRMSWLQDLTAAVDDLNLHFGIAHQDIAPRNLLVDPNTNALVLFNFDQAAKIGGKMKPINGYMEKRNDVDGVIYTLYEIITEDNSFRHIPFWDQDIKDVEALIEWPLKGKLRLIEQ